MHRIRLATFVVRLAILRGGVLTQGKSDPSSMILMVNEEFETTQNPSTDEACISSEWSMQCICNEYDTCGFLRNVTCSNYRLVELNEVPRNQCLFEAQWASWNSWSACDVLCGMGNQTRYRACNDSGVEVWQTATTCSGSANETRSCDHGVSCQAQWTLWNNWSNCDVPCGTGAQTRHRACNGSAFDDGPTMMSCNGTANETRACEPFISCQVGAEWAAWSNWSTCDVPCGVGNQTRYRSCNDTGFEVWQAVTRCNGTTNETQSCDSGVSCQAEAQWTSWSNWSVCDVSCGAGSQTRYRACNNSRLEVGLTATSCNGTPNEVRSCDSGAPCQVQALWTSWNSWSTCSVPCGVGTQARHRACNDSEAGVRQTAASCNGTNNETRTCDSEVSCQVQAEWATWSDWASCSSPCGTGTQRRYRTCNTTATQSWQTITTCIGGIANETRSCDAGVACPAWNEWTQWSACSATCDGGIRKTQRTCAQAIVLPPELGYLSQCTGTSANSSICGIPECPLNEQEAANGVYVVLGTSMTVDEYYGIRNILRSAIVQVIDNFCSEIANYYTCCPGKAKWSYNGTRSYVDNETVILKGAFKPTSDELNFYMAVQPDIENNQLCNGGATVSRRRRAATPFYLPEAAVTSIARSGRFTTTVVNTAKKNGFTVIVKDPISVATATAIKASMMTTTTQAVVSTTATPSNLGLIIGVSVGGGLGLFAIILIIVVMVKKKHAKTGVVEISGSRHAPH